MMLRQQLMHYLWIACLVAASGCDLLSEPPVAEVGPHQITAAALQSFVAEWSGRKPAAQTAAQARRHYLQTMIDARLLLLEARSRGIDTTQGRASNGSERNRQPSQRPLSGPRNHGRNRNSRRRDSRLFRR